MITDILDLSKIEAGKMEIAIEEVNLKELINSLLPTSRGLVKDKAIELHFIIPEDLPNVQADPTRVRQVMINLLSNAAKFTEAGSITIGAAVQDSPQGAPEILLSVADSGIGISPEDQAKLFEPFSQVDASPTRKTGGTGLGLSICRALVEMQGGRIGVSSELGKGSKFFFTLPLSRPASTELPLPQPETPPKLVMVIDDNPQMNALYERYLKNNGYQIISLPESVNAVAEATRLHPFAIIFDVAMAGQDGWQMLQDLKAEPVTCPIPVILCTILEEKEKGLRSGAADYLNKPILEHELVHALDHLDALR
jgi:CheY-like chemotaxis protein/two-component sensor histidine kinase